MAHFAYSAVDAVRVSLDRPGSTSLVICGTERDVDRAVRMLCEAAAAAGRGGACWNGPGRVLAFGDGTMFHVRVSHRDGTASRGLSIDGCVWTVGSVCEADLDAAGRAMVAGAARRAGLLAGEG